jgi:hypothetical protein
MGGPPTHQSVLHDHAAGSDLDAPVLGGHYRAEQHPSVGADVDVATQDGRRSHVGARIDHRARPAMLHKHAGEF